MAPDNTTDYEGAAAAYSTHAEGQRAAREEKHKADLEAQKNSTIQSTDSGLVSVDSPLTEEAKFVANPDGLRKEVDSEEKFSEGLEDSPVEVEVGGETVTDPADDGDTTAEPEPAAAPAPTKAAAKKRTAKKAAAKKS